MQKTTARSGTHCDGNGGAGGRTKVPASVVAVRLDRSAAPSPSADEDIDSMLVRLDDVFIEASAPEVPSGQMFKIIE